MKFTIFALFLIIGVAVYAQEEAAEEGSDDGGAVLGEG